MKEGRGFEKDVLTRRVLEGLTVWAARPSPFISPAGGSLLLGERLVLPVPRSGSRR
jgi:hypothetical protein